MANVLIENSTMQGIANAIRQKDGSSATMLPSAMAEKILAIPSGGGSTDPNLVSVTEYTATTDHLTLATRGDLADFVVDYMATSGDDPYMYIARVSNNNVTGGNHGAISAFTSKFTGSGSIVFYYLGYRTSATGYERRNEINYPTTAGQGDIDFRYTAGTKIIVYKYKDLIDETLL